MDGITFESAFPEVRWLVGPTDVHRWRGELDYWVFLDGQVGQVIAAVHTTVGQLADQLVGQPLAFDFQVAQVLGDLFDAFLVGDFHRQQRVLGPVAQLAVPDVTGVDGLVQPGKKFFGVQAGVKQAVVLAQQLLA